MAVLDIRGVSVGEGRPKTIVSIMDAGLEGLVVQARRALAAGADLLEWRADYLEDPGDVAQVVALGHALRASLSDAPLIFTFRSADQGGRKTLSAERYEELTSALVEARIPDAVDIELGVGEDAVWRLVSLAHKRGVVAIVSHHDFAGTPGRAALERTLERMAELGADIPKLATMAHELGDCLRLMEATSRVAARVDRPLLTMAMGEAGRLSRLAGEVFGSALTFCAVGEASAPGQVALGDARAALDALHAAVQRPNT